MKKPVLIITTAVLATPAAGWSLVAMQPRGRVAAVHVHAQRPARSSHSLYMQQDVNPDSPDDDCDLDAQFNAAQTQEFNKELYAHLSKRPEYENSQVYASLRKRQDVDDPIYSELQARREMLSNTPRPNENQTPGEVIELVLRALRDVDWPRPGHGVDVLRNYSGPASILGPNAELEKGQPEVTSKLLIEYFAESKYSILLDWVSISYTHKLDLSFDKKRALQRLRLASASGE
jgi:hypothetical protein